MKKSERTGAAPLSKYAAKRLANAKAAMEEEAMIEAARKAEEAKVVDKPADTVAGTVSTAGIADEAGGIQPAKPVERTRHYGRPKPVPDSFTGKASKRKGIPNTAGGYPDHIVQIALIVKNNAEIRRFTSLGILNWLYQKGVIKGTDGFVSYKWNKFAVKYRGLMCEYSYSEPFFLNSLVAAFTSFSASAQRTIDNFCKAELSKDICNTIDADEVEAIAELNEKHSHEDVKSGD